MAALASASSSRAKKLNFTSDDDFVRNELVDLFKFLDVSGDGVITGHEVRNRFKAQATELGDDSEERTKLMMQAFDKNKDNKITLQEFLSVMQTLPVGPLGINVVGFKKQFGMPVSLSLETLDELGSIFDYLNTDHDGIISKAEVKHTIKQVDNKALDKLFEGLDQDKNQEITKTEWLAYMVQMFETTGKPYSDQDVIDLKRMFGMRNLASKRVVKELTYIFEMLDQNHDKGVTLDELEKRVPKAACRVLRDADTNKDNRITLDEWLYGMSYYPPFTLAMCQDVCTLLGIPTRPVSALISTPEPQPPGGVQLAAPPTTTSAADTKTCLGAGV